MFAVGRWLVQTGRSASAATRAIPAAAQQCRHLSGQPADIDPATVIETARSVYTDHPAAFHAFNIDDIEFKVGRHFVTGEPYPHVYLGDSERSGLLHVTPWSSVSYASFGEKGTLGQQQRFAKSLDGIVSDPMDAEQQVNISGGELGDLSGPNQTTLDYFAWLDLLREKYIDHLTDYIESYSILMKRLGVLVGKNDRDTLHEMMTQVCTQVIRQSNVEDGVPGPEHQFLPHRQKVYYRTQEGQNRQPEIRCELDEELWARGAARKHIPLFDSKGTEIPLSLASLSKGDVISIQTNVTCQLYDIGGNIGAGLRRNVRSVTLLHQANNWKDKSGYRSPFAGHSIPGGAVYEPAP